MKQSFIVNKIKIQDFSVCLNKTRQEIIEILGEPFNVSIAKRNKNPLVFVYECYAENDLLNSKLFEWHFTSAENDGCCFMIIDALSPNYHKIISCSASKPS